MKNRKEDVIFIVVLLVLVLVFVLFRVFRSEKAEAPIEEGVVPTTVTPAENQPLVKSTKTKKPVITWPELTYTEAFMKYQNGRLMQFGKDCQARPISMVLKNGSELMIDNRQNKEENITIGDKSYKLAPYGYSIITLSAKEIPATYTVNCSQARNVATIVLE